MILGQRVEFVFKNQGEMHRVARTPYIAFAVDKALYSAFQLVTAHIKRGIG